MPPDWWSNSRPPVGSIGSWPNSSADRDADRSGRIDFGPSAGTPVRLIFGPPISLCSAVFTRPTPSVAQIRVALADPVPTNIARVFDFPAQGVLTANGLGRLIFEYGAAASTQRVVCDLRSGSYALPVCEQLKISCQVASGVNGSFEPAVAVTGVIAEGTHIEPTLPTFTHVIANMLSAFGVQIEIPDNARDLDVWLTYSAAARYGVGAPVIGILPSDINGNGSPVMVRDYTNGVFIPPYSARVWGTRPTTFPLIVTTTVDCALALQFTLDL